MKSFVSLLVFSFIFFTIGNINCNPTIKSNVYEDALYEYNECYELIYKEHPFIGTGLDEIEYEIQKKMHSLCPPQEHIDVCIQKMEDKLTYNENLDSDIQTKLQEYITQQKISHRVFCDESKVKLERFIRNGGFQCGLDNLDAMKEVCVGNVNVVSSRDDMNECTTLKGMLKCFMKQYRTKCTNEDHIINALELYYIIKSYLMNHSKCELKSDS